MELEVFLQRLSDFGRHSNYFNVVPIRELNKTCCLNAITEVIDFDEVKNKICSSAKLQPYKSCDALKILPELGRLDFIEMKGFKKFIQYLPHNMSKNQSKLKVDKQIKAFDLTGKLHDSYIVLNIVLHKKSDLKREEIEFFQNVKKNYIVLVDIALEEEGIQNIALTLEFLSETSNPIEKQVGDILLKEIDSLSDLPFNLNKPMLKS